MSKETTWVHGRPNSDLLDPACWTNGVPKSGDKVIVPPHEMEYFPPRGCKNVYAFNEMVLETFVLRGVCVNVRGARSK